MSAHGHGDDAANRDRWVISYADFITLLFAFFVVMYAISSVNEGKYKVLADSLEDAFTKPLKGLEAMRLKNVTDFLAKIKVKDKHSPTNEAINNPNAKNLYSEDIPLKTLIERIQQDFNALIKEGQVELRLEKDWLEIEIKSKLLFTTGGSLLSNKSEPIIKELSNVFKQFPNPITIEGYTDNVPISNEIFPSNWELSADRAASVARALINHGITAERLAVTGYGQNFPKADNATLEGRQQNRRVVFLIETVNKRRDYLSKKSYAAALPNEEILDIKKDKVVTKSGDGLKRVKLPDGTIKFNSSSILTEE